MAQTNTAPPQSEKPAQKKMASQQDKKDKGQSAGAASGIKQRPRMHTLDELRGLAVFCMIFYHAFFTLGYVFDLWWGAWLMNFFSPAEPYFAGLFIVISGVCSNLSHSNLERGVKLAGIALCVTVVTYFALGERDMIKFGILHLLSFCMIFYGIINKYLKLIPSWLGIIFNAALFALTYNIVHHIFGIPPLFSVTIPDQWYSTKFLFMVGLPDNNFYSSDYFPIIPWMFLFFAGTYLGRIGVKRKFPKFMFKKRIPFFAFLGRHSLLIYIIHQPIIFGLCYAAKGVVSVITAARMVFPFIFH